MPKTHGGSAGHHTLHMALDMRPERRRLDEGSWQTAKP